MAKDPFKGEVVEFSHPNEEDYQKFVDFLSRHSLRHTHFVITNMSKEGHPWERRITCKDAFAVNGKRGRTIFLIRGQRYFFTFRQAEMPLRPEGPFEHLLCFTTDPMGGPEALPLTGTPAPFGEFKTVSFRIDDKFPETFYYQCHKQPFLGGPIIVHTHIFKEMTRERSERPQSQSEKKEKEKKEKEKKKEENPKKKVIEYTTESIGSSHEKKGLRREEISDSSTEGKRRHRRKVVRKTQKKWK